MTWLLLALLVVFIAVFVLGRSSGKRDGYWPLPGANVPELMDVPDHAGDHEALQELRDHYIGTRETYRGAFEMDELDTFGEYGHTDRTTASEDYRPDGTPYDTDRVQNDYGNPPHPKGVACYDDEAHGGTIDADELNAYHVRARNDQTRVIAGTMQRLQMMDPYLREELEEEENRPWWGRHEW